MERININDLPKDMKISKAEMKRILGGIGTWPTPDMPYLNYYPRTPLRWFGNPMGQLSIETVPLPE